MAIYNGFSTLQKNKRFKLTDFELIKRDLLNHFHIRRGEKLMNPNFGCIIWGMLFEPLTDDLRTAITEDVKRIIGYEIRVRLDSIILTEFQQGLHIEVELTYLTTNQIETLSLRFTRDSKTITVVG